MTEVITNNELYPPRVIVGVNDSVEAGYIFREWRTSQFNAESLHNYGALALSNLLVIDSVYTKGKGTRVFSEYIDEEGLTSMGRRNISTEIFEEMLDRAGKGEPSDIPGQPDYADVLVNHGIFFTEKG